MLPNFLIPEAVIREDGEGPPLDLGSSRGKSLLLTLGITRIIEQEALEVSICGSADNVTWDDKPIAAFPQKFYCGTYQLLVDLTGKPDAQYLRARYKVGRWGHGTSKPLFGAYLFAQDAEAPAAVRTA
jgi:hypothetical protein